MYEESREDGTHLNSRFKSVQMISNLDELPVFVKELTAGGVAGMIGKSSVAPLERVKILYQTGAMKKISVFEMLVKLRREEGMLGLFKGNGASVARIIPYSAIHFHAYEIYRRELTNNHILQDALTWFNSKMRVLNVHFIAGSCAGATAVLVTYPLDVARTRLACMSEVDGKAWRWKTRLTIRSVLSDLVKENGIRAVYRGMGPTLLGIVPYAGVKFYVYQSMKDFYVRRWHPSKDRLPIPIMLSFGGVAGLIGQTVSYPLDVVRRRMQVPDYSTGFDPHHIKSPNSVYTSTWDALRKIVSSGGYRSLFRGLSINYIKVIPSTAIGFTTYDYLMSSLGLKYHL